jgi:hypothetical protein
MLCEVERTLCEVMATSESDLSRTQAIAAAILAESYHLGDILRVLRGETPFLLGGIVIV